MNKFKLYTIVLAILSIVFLMCECKSPTNGDTAEWQTVFFDDFNRNDGPVGSNYLVTIWNVIEDEQHTLSIFNNKLTLSSGGVILSDIRYVNEVTNDVIRFSLKCSTTNPISGSYEGFSYGFGIQARSRFISNNNREAYSGVVEGDTIRIIKKMPGGELESQAYGELASQAYNIQANKSYLLELTVDKENITFTVKDLETGIAETLNGTDTGSMLGGYSKHNWIARSRGCVLL